MEQYDYFQDNDALSNENRALNNTDSIKINRPGYNIRTIRSK